MFIALDFPFKVSSQRQLSLRADCMTDVRHCRSQPKFVGVASLHQNSLRMAVDSIYMPIGVNILPFVTTPDILKDPSNEFCV